MYPPFGPLLFQVGPLSLHWYGLILVTAIVLAAWVASSYVARHGQASSRIWDMLLWVIIPALIGGRLYYVFIQSPRGPTGLDQYLAHPLEIVEIWRGGIHIYGAFIFGGIALTLYLFWKKLPFLLYLDAVALALPLGQALGRWANFINQELYGPPTTLPWGLRIDAAHRLAPYDNLARYPASVRFQPLFLYESLANALGFGLLFWIARRFEKRLRPGDLFLLYLIYYPSVRFCLEFLRTDSWFFPGTPFNVVHLLSAVAIVTALTLLLLRHRKAAPAVEGERGPGGGGGSEQGSEEERERPSGEKGERGREAVGADVAEASEEGEHAGAPVEEGQACAGEAHPHQAELGPAGEQTRETAPAEVQDRLPHSNGSLEDAAQQERKTVGNQSDGMM